MTTLTPIRQMVVTQVIAECVAVLCIVTTTSILDKQPI